MARSLPSGFEWGSATAAHQIEGGNWNNDQFESDYNVFWSTAEPAPRLANWTLEEWQQKGHDRASLIADPLFEDPQNGDFRLRPGSPALALGFKAIDMSTVGPAPEKAPGTSSAVRKDP